MRVGILQFGPELKALDKNIARVDALIEKLQPGDLDLLVLPELALTGYNYTSLSDIKPYLEPTASGPSAAWARKTAARLQCTVSVGYPEVCENDGYPKHIDGKLHPYPPDSTENRSSKDGISESKSTSFSRNYNALLTVDPSGALIAHYRKTNLYYTDVSWSWPGPDGFGLSACQLPLKLFSDVRRPEQRSTSTSTIEREQSSTEVPEGHATPTAFGICMDLNPMHFTAPWEDYELATHAKRVNARLIIASNAWLTNRGREHVELDPDKFDPETISYWVARLRPLLNQGGGWQSNDTQSAYMGYTHTGDTGGLDDDGTTHGPGSAALLSGGRENERIVVLANRVGIEPGGVEARDLTRGCPPEYGEEGGGRGTKTSNGQIEQQAAAETGAGASAAMSVEPSLAAPGSSEDAGENKMADEAVYAGSSCVIGLRGDGCIRVYGQLGRAEEKLLLVNTDDEPAWIGQLSGAT